MVSLHENIQNITQIGLMAYEMIMSYDLLLTGSIIAGQASAWYAWPHLQV